MPGKKRFSKKSQLEDLLPLLLLIVFLVFLLIFASCTKQIKENKLRAEIEFQSIKQDSSQLLLSFLKSPVDLDGYENIDVADAMNLYVFNEDESLLEEISKRAKDFFGTSILESDRSFWSLHFRELGERSIIIESDDATLGFSGSRAITTVTIPSYSEELVEIQLFIFFI